MNKKLFSLFLLLVNTQFNTYTTLDDQQIRKAKQAVEDEQQEAPNSQHYNTFFNFDKPTIRQSPIDPIFQTHLNNTEESSSSQAMMHPNLQSIDYITKHFDELMNSTKILESDCESIISIKNIIRKKLDDLKHIVEIKKMLAFCIEMQKKQNAAQDNLIMALKN